MDWIGIYRRQPIAFRGTQLTDSLVKQAYRGSLSRAVFPLTAEFAAGSNNSNVAMTGKAVVIPDVQSYSGPYYICSGTVRSEACLPIYDAACSRVIGLLDAESDIPNFFTDEVVLDLCKVCAELGAVNMWEP
eukprot:TRINITY_DN9218_c0_g1_i1.p1 TRINITY_DN9218_c0_g1~~TRINITY_DN9218_c0_g1_i1.p1  ORF type:complete len:132 (-),score=34.12 TRINITY_DN9218_c0_g1_i1:217-612(-)